MSAHQQLYVFTGENSFALAEEVHRWKEQFVAKHGPENFVELLGTEVQEESLLDVTTTAPFIAERRLVICRGMPRLERDAVRRLVEEIHPQTLLLIADSTPDKRLSSTKEFLKIAQEAGEQHAKTFPLLKRPALVSWVRARATSLGCTIEEREVHQLLSIVGEDQWGIVAELAKLSLVGPVITAELIESLVVPSGEQVIWELSDLLASERIHDAQAFYRKCIDRGHDPYDLWIALLTFIRNIAAVWICLQSGKRDTREIAEITKIHPFVIPKVLPLAKVSTSGFIHALVDAAVRFDIGIKTGGYHVTAERPEEIIAIAERMILACERT